MGEPGESHDVRLSRIEKHLSKVKNETLLVTLYKDE
jgi:hypothetical protein